MLLLTASRAFRLWRRRQNYSQWYKWPTQPPALSGMGNEYQPVWRRSAAGE